MVESATVETGEAEHIGRNSVTVNATVTELDLGDLDASSTKLRFRYTEADDVDGNPYEESVWDWTRSDILEAEAIYPSAVRDGGSGGSATLDGLEPGTEYYYTAYVGGASGRYHGDIHSFRTAEATAMGIDRLGGLDPGDTVAFRLEWDGDPNDATLGLRDESGYEARTRIPVLPYVVPDFIVENVDIPSVAGTLEDVSGSFDVVNTGQPGDVRVTGPGVDVEETLGNGESLGVEFGIPTDEPGIRNLTFDIINEGAGETETLSRAIEVGAPDIGIAGVPSSVTGVLGESLDVPVVLENEGAGTGQYTLDVGGEEFVGVLDPGEVVEHVHTTSYETVDGDVVGVELVSGETETPEEADVSIGPGSVSASLVDVEAPAEVNVGEPYEVVTTVEADGDAPVDYTVFFEGQSEEGSLEPGETAEHAFQLTPDAPGSDVGLVELRNDSESLYETEVDVVTEVLPDPDPDPEPDPDPDPEPESEFVVVNRAVPSSVETGEAFDISLNIQNVGDGEGDVIVHIGDSAEHATLSANETTRLASTFSHSAPGERTYGIVLENDSTGRIDDTLTVTVTVEPDESDSPPTPTPPPAPEPDPIIVEPPDIDLPDYPDMPDYPDRPAPEPTPEPPRPPDEEYDGLLTYLDPLGVLGTTRQLPTVDGILGRDR